MLGSRSGRCAARTKLAELFPEAVLLAVPGNHDLFRPKPEDDNPAADTLREKGAFERIAAKF